MAPVKQMTLSNLSIDGARHGEDRSASTSFARFNPVIDKNLITRFSTILLLSQALEMLQG